MLITTTPEELDSSSIGPSTTMSPSSVMTCAEFTPGLSEEKQAQTSPDNNEDESSISLPSLSTTDLVDGVDPAMALPNLEEDSQNSTNQLDSSETPAAAGAPRVWDHVRKAGVAVAGGTMVVVGSIMIPLPTPFGAVIAGSGLAVLGTEFEGAKQVHDQLVDTTKQHVDTARNHLKEKIKKVAEAEKEKEDAEKNAAVEDEQEPAGPSWMYMNLKERQRQEQIRQAKLKKEKENREMSVAGKAHRFVKTRTTGFLTKSVLPLLESSSTEQPKEVTCSEKVQESLQVEESVEAIEAR